MKIMKTLVVLVILCGFALQLFMLNFRRHVADMDEMRMARIHNPARYDFPETAAMLFDGEDCTVENSAVCVTEKGDLYIIGVNVGSATLVSMRNCIFRGDDLGWTLRDNGKKPCTINGELAGVFIREHRM